MPKSNPENEGMSSSTKVVLIILGAGGVLALVCCGGIIWFGKSMADKVQNAMSSDPARIREVTASVIDITVPDVYAPKMAMDFGMMGMQMKMCAYSRAGDAGGVFIMEMTAPPSANKDQMKQQFQQSLRQQGQNQDVTIESTETRTFTINGEECAFEFIKGKNTQNNQDMRQVMGVIPGKSGAAFLMVFETEENWDEAAIVQMIESMGGTEVTSTAAPATEEAPVEPAPAEAPGDASSATPAADSTPTP
jgi:hypothetical protein